MQQGRRWAMQVSMRVGIVLVLMETDCTERVTLPDKMALRLPKFIPIIYEAMPW